MSVQDIDLLVTRYALACRAESHKKGRLQNADLPHCAFLITNCTFEHSALPEVWQGGASQGAEQRSPGGSKGGAAAHNPGISSAFPGHQPESHIFAGGNTPSLDPIIPISQL